MGRNQELSSLEDVEFVKAFQDCTLDPKLFDHEGHMRLAWLFLIEHPVEVAASRFCMGLQSYAASVGHSEKFHRTVTEALVRICARREGENPSKCWKEFMDKNFDLVNDCYGHLLLYYTEAVLNSERARLHWVAPDVKPLEHCIRR
jgi:hypothetical protein